MRLSYGVVKQEPRLSGEVRDVKRVFHQEEDVHVIGDGLHSNKRPKHHTAGEVPCCPCHIVDAFETHAHDSCVAANRYQSAPALQTRSHDGHPAANHHWQ